MTVSLNGRVFSPVENSSNGSVTSDAKFTFTQNGRDFSAYYSGDSVTDGHLIGQMTGESTAKLIYHSRALNGALEAGEAQAQFTALPDKRLVMTLDWQWLNGDKSAGQSRYEEIL